jgi:hypothetical protein
MMDYYNGVQGFINYALLIQEILVEVVLDIRARGVRIKNLLIQML